MNLYFDHKTPFENQVTLGNVVIYLRWFKVIICQVLVIITVETFDLH